MRLISLLLALNVAFIAPAHSQTDVAPDQELWNSLRDIQNRIQTRSLVRGGILFTLAAPFVGGGTYAAAHWLENLDEAIIKKHLNSNVKIAGLTVVMAMASTASMATIFGGPTVFVGGTVRDFTSFKSGQRAFYRMEGESYVDGALAEIRKLTKRPLHEQYHIVAADPQLREFIVRFDEWLRESVGHDVAPPVRPALSLK